MHDSIAKTNLKKRRRTIMHKKIINTFKNFFKKNNTENINIDELTKESYFVESEDELLNKSIKIKNIDITLTKSQQNFDATPNQLKILKKIANGRNVQLNQKKELKLF